MRFRSCAFLVVAVSFWASGASALSGSDVIARAESWVAAGMPYCQCANHAWDSHGQCNRPDNPEWDPYRSDCSGFVSYAWGLGAPGLICDHPYSISLWTVSATIDAMALLPGDALNSTEHVMLFKAWVVPGSVATLIDEHDWGTNASEQDFAVSVNGSTVTRLDWPSNPFTAIRLNGIEQCQPHCEGTQIVGSDCGKGDCAPFAATCVDDALGVRCASVLCPPNGHHYGCVDETKTVECQDGIPVGTGDCAVYAAMCSTAVGPEAACVSDFCVTDPKQAPVVHDTCLPNGQLGHCDGAGIPTGEDCPSGQVCVSKESSAACADPSLASVADEDAGADAHSEAGASSDDVPSRGGTESVESGCSLGEPAASRRSSPALFAWILLVLRVRRRSRQRKRGVA